MNLECLLIADDLTGACDAAAPFAARGLATQVALSTEVQSVDSCDVLALNTSSRDVPAMQIDCAMRAAAAYGSRFTPRVLFKKIDSTLRGNIALELESAMRHFGYCAAVVCPAFPALGRVVREGFLCVEYDNGFEPIQLSTQLSCAHFPAGKIRRAIARGQRLISVDAACDQDLDAIAAELLSLETPVLWAGSAGLASALARSMRAHTVESAVPNVRGPVLFCIGSTHPVTNAQAAALIERTASTCIDASLSGENIAAFLRDRHVVLRMPRGKVAEESIRAYLKGAAPSAIVLSGGDTALFVCRALNVDSIQIRTELLPGIPLGVMCGGAFDGAHVITKSGGFGAPDALLRIADYFSCPKH
ncbi:MAG TPA: four-carbon acid sugar kinase family protein [Bryobacteraceae bacterium]|nr:four-carbon acid sugar kinase family protein [Bryobacteraceae bacterium]